MKNAIQLNHAGKSALKSLASAVAIAAMPLLGTGAASAAVTYEYTGLNFTSVDGDAPQVTTSDHLSGFVTFTSEPTAGGTLYKSDVVAFLLTDGVRTLSSAGGDHEFFNDDFFTFDSSLQIADWQFSVVPGIESDNVNNLYTSPTFDISRLGAGRVQSATNPGGGSWTAVPEPASLSLLAVGGTLLIRRKRR